MSRSRPFPGSRYLLLAVLFCAQLSFANRLDAQTPGAPPPDQSAKTDQTARQPAQPSNPADTQEVSSRDTPATFKVRVNNVLVRVVVRDAQGKVVSNLKKEDFQLYDGRKLQTISSFSIETPQSHTASAVKSSGADGESSSADALVGKAAVLPQRFVSMVFDDIHMSLEDAAFVRDSATRFFGALAPSDRVAINTTSGQFAQDFTDDHALLEKALLAIVPRPLAMHGSMDCPEMGYYQADLIVNKNDTQALAVATEDTLQCAFNGDTRMTAAAQSMAQAAALSA